MKTQFELFAAEALKLTPDEREALAQLLLASLDEAGGIDEVLEGEIERRIADIESGVTQVIAMDEALAQVRAGLK